MILHGLLETVTVTTALPQFITRLATRIRKATRGRGARLSARLCRRVGYCILHDVMIYSIMWMFGVLNPAIQSIKKKSTD